MIPLFYIQLCVCSKNVRDGYFCSFSVTLLASQKNVLLMLAACKCVLFVSCMCANRKSQEEIMSVKLQWSGLRTRASPCLHVLYGLAEASVWVLSIPGTAGWVLCHHVGHIVCLI